MSEQTPSVTLHLLRHAETPANRDKSRVCGRSPELGITFNGALEAVRQGSATKAKRALITPDLIYSSPDTRHRQTMTRFLLGRGLKVTPQYDDRLCEVSQGLFEGRLRSEAYSPEVVEQITQNPEGYAAPEGESILDGDYAMSNFMGRVLADAHQFEGPVTALAATSGFKTRIKVGKLLNWSVPEMRRESLTPNCSITTLVHAEGVWSVQRIGVLPTDLLKA